MAKKLTFSKVLNSKPNTKQHYRMVSKLLKLKPNPVIMGEIGKRRKENYTNLKGFKISQIINIVESDTKYLNAIKERDYEILSGAYIKNRANTYINNYINALKAMTIDKRIIDWLERNPNAIIEGTLPEIDNYYKYLKGKGKSKKGKNYIVNLDDADNLEDQLINRINTLYDDTFSEQFVKGK